MPLPNYPDILKEADWQKKKGALAKAAGETGVGAAMKALWANRNNTDWTDLQVATTYKSLAEVDEAIQKYKAAMPKLEKLKTDAYKVRDLARAAAAKFKANKLIPKASADHAGAVATAADHYGVAIKSYDPSADFAEARKRVEAREKIGRDQLKKSIATVEGGVVKVDRDKVTYEEWQAFWSGPLRGLQAAVAVVPEIKGTQISEVVRKLCSADFCGNKSDTDAKAIRQKAATVKVAVGKLKAQVA